MTNQLAKLVIFGNGGHSVHFATVHDAYGSSTQKLSGYATPESPDGPKDIPDGTPVIDLREPCKRREGVVMTIQGPMVNVDLAPGQVLSLGKVRGIVAEALSRDPHNQFGQLVNLHNKQQDQRTKYGALDEVAIDIYLDLWRPLGARIGTYQNGRPVFEE